MLEARQGAWWDANKIGLSPPPIETPRGWLMIYHGVRHTAAGCLYRLGLALFELDEPERCLLRGDEWVFGPEETYERKGDVGNVVFPCGYTLGADGDTLEHVLRRRGHVHRARHGQHARAAVDWLEEHRSAYISRAAPWSAGVSRRSGVAAVLVVKYPLAGGARTRA